MLLHNNSDMAIQDKLNRAVRDYCGKLLSRNVLVWRYGLSAQKKKELKKWKYKVDEKKCYTRYLDFPAATVSCSDDSGSIIKSDYARESKQNHLFPALKAVLEFSLGPIGTKVPQRCPNIIGHCAEVHAADAFLKRKKGIRVDDIVFSEALRPATRERLDYCFNCKSVFSSLK